MKSVEQKESSVAQARRFAIAQITKCSKRENGGHRRAVSMVKVKAGHGRAASNSTRRFDRAYGRVAKAVERKTRAS